MRWRSFMRRLNNRASFKPRRYRISGSTLGELAKVATEGAPDEGVVHRVLQSLSARFEQLTSRAQTFLRSLQRTIDLQGITVEKFLLYKTGAHRVPSSGSSVNSSSPPMK